jgi:hypothetical protein
MAGFSHIEIDYNCYNTSPATGSHSIVGDPLFTNAGSWDFSLTGSSPVLGEGNAASGVVYDLELNNRSLSTPSMGCYE